MAYKKYIKRGDKVYGPYTYKSKREGRKVITEYVGKNEKKKVKSNSKLKFLWLLIPLAIILITLLAIKPVPTGKIVMEAAPVYKANETITGDVKIIMRRGELIPADSLLRVSLNEQEKQVLLSQILTVAEAEGRFYVENVNLKGEGNGYGFLGEKRIYPKVSFKLLIYKDEEKRKKIEELAKPKEKKKEKKKGEVTGEETDEEKEKKDKDEEETDEEKEKKDKDGADITGEVVLESTIKGKVSASSDFEYKLDDDDYVEIIEGSVMAEGIELSSSQLNLEIEDGLVRVTTDYYIVEETGFGPEFLIDEKEVISISLEDFDLAAEVGTLNILIAYDDLVMASMYKKLRISEQEILELQNVTINITTTANDSIIRQVKDIPDIIVKNNSNYTLQLSEYFFSSFDMAYSAVIPKNISINIFDEKAVIIPDTDFMGTRASRIIAQAGNQTIESNMFNIIVSDKDMSISTLQYKTRIGEPVRWKKKIKLDKPKNLIVQVPALATNISVKKIRYEEGERVEEAVEEEAVEEVEEAPEEEVVEENVTEEEMPEEKEKPKPEKVKGKVKIKSSNMSGQVTIPVTVTGQVMLTVDIEKKPFSFTEFFRKLFRSIEGGIIGRVIEEDIVVITQEVNENVSEVIIEDNGTEYEIDYETPAAVAYEEETEKGKKIIISGPEGLHYTEILAYTELPKEVSESSVRLYHLIDDERKEVKENISKYDLNNNGLIDYIEWVVPYLSNQTYELVIEITKAEHLDENRDFIEDIYEDVKEKDDIWSKQINDQEYVRATFEIPLHNTRDITLYARSNASSDIEVYIEDGSEVITRFSNITGENWYKVFLTNLPGGESYETFDLRVIGNSAEIDYIVDPTGYVDPDGDVTTDWNYIYPAGGTHESKIDEINGNQGNLDTNDYIRANHGEDPDYCGASYLEDEFNMETIASVSSVSAIKIWAHGDEDSGEGCSLWANIKKDAVWQTQKDMSVPAVAAWMSVEWTGLSWTQTNLDNLQVRLRMCCNEAEAEGSVRVNAMYAEITYEEAVAADTTNPEVTLNEPSDAGTIIFSNATLNCTATDNIFVQNITGWINYTDWSRNDTVSTPGNNTKATIFVGNELPDGTYLWNCESCDNSSNCAYGAANYTFTVDATAPSGFKIYPENNTVNNTLSVKFRVNVTDEINLANQIFYFWNASSGEEIATYTYNHTGNQDENLINYTKSFTDNGVYFWSVLASDASGNSAWADSGVDLNWTINISSDKTSPEVTLNAPADVSTLVYYNTSLNCTPIDSTNVTNVSLWINQTSWHLNQTNHTMNNTKNTFFVDLPEGTYLWNCEACDNSSNCAYGASNYTFTVSLYRGYLDPDGDVTKEWTRYPATGTHEDKIDEINGNQGNLDINDFILGYSGEEEGWCDAPITYVTDEFNMETFTVDSVNAIKIWAHGDEDSGEGCTLRANIKKDAVWQTAQDMNVPATQAWMSVTFSELSWTQTNLDNLQVRLEMCCEGAEGDGTVRINAMYAEIAYLGLEDSVNPEVTLNEPSDASTISFSNATLNCTATDNIFVQNITGWINYTDWSRNDTVSTPGNNTKATIFVGNELPDGTYLWNCESCDNSSNCAYGAANYTFSIDTTAPTFSGVSAEPVYTEAIITWTNSEAANLSIAYGKTIDMADSTTETGFATSHSKTLESLDSGTGYYYNITCCDATGNCNSSGRYEFTTLSPSGNGKPSNGGGGGGTPAPPEPTCEDQCVLGRTERECTDLNTSRERTCGNYDTDSCTEWSGWDYTVCGIGECCELGVCVTCIPEWECSDWGECFLSNETSGVTGSVIAEIGITGQSIFDWFKAKPCEIEGETRCHPTNEKYYQTCVAKRGNLQWKSYRCSSGLVCVGAGECGCSEENSCEIEGETECRSNLVYECKKDRNNCLKWSSLVRCASGEVCVEGACVREHCNDGVQNYDEEQVDCGGSCKACLVKCTENWECTNWSECIDSMQTRICDDLNACGTILNKPSENQDCEMPPSLTEKQRLIDFEGSVEIVINKGDKLTVTYDEKHDNSVILSIGKIKTSLSTDVGENHIITINEISEEKVKVTVQSEPVTTDIGLGETKIFDFDSLALSPEGVLIQVRECIDLKKCGLDEEKPLEIKLCGEACVESWTCDDWSDCINGREIRKCTDSNKCGTTDYKPDTVRYCECVEDWKCDWSDCVLEDDVSYTYPINCIDLNDCDTENTKPGKLICTYVNDTIVDPDTGEIIEIERLVGIDEFGNEICLPKWSCTNISECEIDYILKDLIDGKEKFEGTIESLCVDLYECEDSKIVKISCDIVLMVEVRKVEWCEEEYIEISDRNTNKLVGRIKKTELTGLDRVDIGFVIGNFTGYCDYCYDGVQNYDEEQVDCGGPNCPCCVEAREWYDWWRLLIWALWGIFLCLVVAYIIYIRNLKKAGVLFGMKRKLGFKVKKVKSKS